MPNEMVLGTGFLPLASEGDFNNTAVLHFPADIGIMELSSEGEYELVDSKKGLFKYEKGGAYRLVSGSHSIHQVPTPAAGQLLGVYGRSGLKVNSSGISIAMGVDLGAGFGTEASLDTLAKFLGSNPKMAAFVNLLKPATGKMGTEAIKVFPAINASVAAYMPLKPQDILDLTYSVCKKVEEGISSKKYPFFTMMHPALRQVVIRANYSSVTRGNKVSDAIAATAILQHPATEGSENYSSSFIAQCDCVIAALTEDGFDKEYAGSATDKIATLRGLIAYVQGLRAAQINNPAFRIRIENRPTQVAELTDVNAPTSQLLTQAKQGALLYKAGSDEKKQAKALQYSYANDMTKSIESAQYKKYIIPIQQKLNALGFKDQEGKKLGEDGNWGKSSAQALASYQKSKGFSVTGKIDESVIQALLGAVLPKTVPTPIPTPNPNPLPTPNPNDRRAELNAKYAAAFKQGKGEIVASVGVSGKNNTEDVRTIRGLLYFHKYLPQDPITVLGSAENYKKYGQSDAELENAIRRFQSEKAKLAKPDGRVDADGGTLKVLNGKGLKPNPEIKPIATEEEALVLEPLAAESVDFPCFN